MKPTLVVMAAGMGSRFGGLKQMEPIGPNGELIIDYSIYDAINAGFDKVVFIIKKELEETFRECIGTRLSQYINIEYVYQEIENVPNGVNYPKERSKPWGTAHAVLSCKDVVKTPFAVINADDFYGRTSFQKLADFLKLQNDETDFFKYCMIGFKLSNTLTENGHVARGVCKADENDNLVEIIERTHIEKRDDIAVYTEDQKTFIPLDINSLVSMNTWGFSPSIFNELENNFIPFFQENKENLLKAEFFLPSVVDTLINNHKAKVTVLPCDEKWYGVTYKEDKEIVVASIANLIKQGRYPNKLWSEFKNE